MDNFYRDNILDHYRNPRNFGRIPNPDLTNDEENITCGDRIGIDLNIVKDKISDIRFHGEGCAISMSSASMLTEKLLGEDIKSVRKMGKEAVLSLLGIELSPARLKCALLPLEAIQNCLAKYKK
jgi:nitrogen fixation protein NifU and related proteins